MNIFELSAQPEVHDLWLAYDKARRDAQDAYCAWAEAVKAAMAKDKEERAPS